MKKFRFTAEYLVWCSLLVISLFCVPPSSGAEDSDRVKAAAAEGRVVLYTVMSSGNNQKLVDAFQKKYPGVQVETWRGGTESMLTRVLTEARAGALKADLIFSGASEMQVFKKRKLLQKYSSPEVKLLPEGYVDPQGYWVTVHPLLQVTAYNTSVVSGRNIPQSYEDLLNPRWKGKMSMDRVEYDWFATLQKVWGKEKTIEYCEKLAAQDIRFDSGHTKIATLVAAGDIEIGINMYGYRVASLKRKGAPIDFVGLDPVVAILEVIGITAKASHPNAAKLLADFMLSLEGQEVIRSFGRVPGVPGIKPSDSKLAKLRSRAYPTATELIYEEGLDTFGSEYRRIFGLQ